MKFLTLFTSLVLAAFIHFVPSQIHAQSLLKYVPSQADVVLSYHPDRLDKKVALEDILSLPFMEEIKKPENQDPELKILADFLYNMEDTGIKPLTPWHIFYIQSDTRGDVVVILNEVESKAKMKNYFKDNFDTHDENMGTKNGFHYFAFEEEISIWNDKVCLSMKHFNDPSENNTNESPKTRLQRLQNEGIEYLMLVAEGEDNIYDNPDFTDAYQLNDDIHLWVSDNMFRKFYERNNNLLKNSPLGSDLPLEEEFGEELGEEFLNQYLKNTKLSLGVNFDDGEASLKTRYKYPEAIQNTINAYLDGDFNRKLFRHIEGNQLFGLFALNTNSKGAREEMMNFARSYSSAPEVQSAIDLLDLILDEDAIDNVWKGSMILAVTDLKEYTTTYIDYEYDENFEPIPVEKTTTQEMPTLVMAMDYGDEKAFEKLIKIGKRHEAIIHIEKNLYILNINEGDALGNTMYLAYKKGTCIISNDLRIAKGKKVRRKNRLPKDVCQMIESNAQVMYLDVENIYLAAADLLGEDGQLGIASTAVNVGKESIKSIAITLSNQNGYNENKFSFNFHNKKANALKQITNYINSLYEEEVNKNTQM